MGNFHTGYNLRCPACGSENLSAKKKGFDFKRAVIGSLFMEKNGMFAGFFGYNKIKVRCQDCGYYWYRDDD